MKKSFIITGAISAAMVLLGCLFKVQHYPGASFLLLIGTLLFSMVTLTFFLIYRIKIKRNNFDLVAAIVITVTCWFLSMGLLFKIQHYPGASFFLFAGQFLAIFGLLPVVIISFNKAENPLSGLNFIALLAGITGITMASTINYSRESLAGHVVSYRQMNNYNYFQMDRNEALFALVSQDEDLKASADRIKAVSNSVWMEIEEAQIKLIATTDQLPMEIAKEMEAWEMQYPDNQDVATQLFIGSDYFEPSTEPGSALSLKKSLEDQASELRSLMKNPENQKVLDNQLGLFFESVSNPPETWEVENFYHTPAISAAHVIESMQSLSLGLEELAYRDLMEQQGSN